MKRFLISILIILALFGTAGAADFKSYPDSTPTLTQVNALIAAATVAVQISTTLTATAGEAISAGDVVKIINDGGAKAYKFMTAFGLTLYTENSNMSNSVAMAYPIRATQLTSTTFAVIFINDAGSRTCSVVCKVNTNKTITAGTINTDIAAGDKANYVTISRLTDTTFALIYTNSSNKIDAKIGTYNTGTTVITLGNVASNITGANCGYISSAPLSATTFAVAGKGTYLDTVVCSVSGTTVIPGTVKTNANNSSQAYNTGMCPMTNTSYVVTYRGTGWTTSAVICTYNTGTTVITNGTPIDNITDGNDPGETVIPCALTSTTFACAYKGTSSYLNAVICTISGANISKGTIKTGITSVAITGQVATTRLNDVSFAIAFHINSSGIPAGVACIYNTADSIITSGEIAGISNSAGTSAFAIPLTMLGNEVVYVYGNSYLGARDTLTIPPPINLNILPAISNSATNSGASGIFTLATPGLKYTNAAYSFTALTPYYLNATTGAIQSTAVANYYLGIALDTTSIMIDGAPILSTAGASGTVPPISMQRK